jgi:3-deoxy-D-manno-octulosonate 8-phosphate phosphatase (KDO 8-P phosphatase)
MQVEKIIIDEIDAFIFDFDGVLTNNMVYLDQNGKELVGCSRSDGLAFDLLRKLGKKYYIISTERNSVVRARAKKLKAPVLQGISSKVDALKGLAMKENFNLEKSMYVGNDVNDYQAMQLCGYSACPADSHNDIKKIATFILKKDGGSGVIRELLEGIFSLNFIEILYS